MGPGESILDDDDITPIVDSDGDTTTDLCPVCNRSLADESIDHAGCDDE